VAPSFPSHPPVVEATLVQPEEDTAYVYSADEDDKKANIKKKKKAHHHHKF